MVGVEADDATPTEIGKYPLKVSFAETEESPGCRQDRARLFQKWRPVRCAGNDRGQEPQERRRQSQRGAPGFDLWILPLRERRTITSRVPAPIARWADGAAASSDGSMRRPWARRRTVPPRTQDFCRCQARHPAVRGCRWPGSACGRPASATIVVVVETHDCSQRRTDRTARA